MSNRSLDRGWTIGKRIISVRGSFATNGNATPTVAGTRGQGFRKTAVTRTGVGTYVVTFDDPYLDLDDANAHLQLPAAADNTASVGPVASLSATTGPTMTIFTLTAGAAADIAANANSRVFFNATFRDSNVGQGKP